MPFVETIITREQMVSDHGSKAEQMFSSAQSDMMGGGLDTEYRQRVRWRSVGVHIYITVTGLIGLYYAIFYAQWKTLAWAYLVYVIGMTGCTVGHHRLWSHRTFKANLPMRILLMLMTCVTMQNPVFEWALDHRCHHKWTDTDSDPHNSRRGLFFCHWGWLMMEKHREVERKAATINIDDLKAEPVLQFQNKYWWQLAVIFSYILPTVTAVYFWNEHWVTSLFVQCLRYMISLHLTYLINSVAHFFGYKPYDKDITATQNVMASFFTLGEGWHNYHHTFPRDYKTAELPWVVNFSTIFIDFFYTIGWATDLKETSKEAIERQKRKQKELPEGVEYHEHAF